jgi:hypothetical protein
MSSTAEDLGTEENIVSKELLKNKVAEIKNKSIKRHFTETMIKKEV